MTHTYQIDGMTCSKCVTKVKSELLKLGDITEAEVRLTAPQAEITMSRHIPTAQLQAAIDKAGHYTISDTGTGMDHDAGDRPVSWLKTYKPLLLIGAYITSITLLAGGVSGQFYMQRWMTNFMAAFFLVFSFFKLLDLKGFAENYSQYDIIAGHWAVWGYIYVFIELGLGIAFLTQFNPVLTNALTFALMSISLVGVVRTVAAKRQIRCACLGAVFNLPMSIVTIVEDGLMIAMSLFMLLSLNNIIH